MSRVATRSHVSAEDYLAWERVQEGKHEYFHGEIFAMAGGSPRHNALCARVIRSLGNQLTGCEVMTSDQRIGFSESTRYAYPDVTVVCGALELEAHDVLKNPAVIVEVLSAETEQYDRGSEWEGYQRIPSLGDYVLVSQREARIEQFQRSVDGTWTYRTVRAGERIMLSTGASLAVDEIFAGVFSLPGD